MVSGTQNTVIGARNAIYGNGNRVQQDIQVDCRYTENGNSLAVVQIKGPLYNNAIFGDGCIVGTSENAPRTLMLYGYTSD